MRTWMVDGQLGHGSQDADGLDGLNMLLSDLMELWIQSETLHLGWSQWQSLTG